MNGEMDTLKNDVHNINRRINEMQISFADMKSSFNDMRTSLVGAEMSKDGGMFERIRKSEMRLLVCETQIDLLKEKNTKMEVYQKIMWTVVGGGGVMMIKFLLETIFK